jgi:multisubunit Na+/H+ antiporter MnhE subunit
MILVTHITIALLSMVYTTYLYVRPSLQKTRIATGLVTATLVSGFYLVVSLKTAILRTCITGLLYVAVMTAGIILAQRKLAKQTIDS